MRRRSGVDGAEQFFPPNACAGFDVLAKVLAHCGPGRFDAGITENGRVDVERTDQVITFFVSGNLTWQTEDRRRTHTFLKN